MPLLVLVTAVVFGLLAARAAGTMAGLAVFAVVMMGGAWVAAG